jgi:hypothetical protein
MGKFESSDSELLRVYQSQMPSLRGGRSRGARCRCGTGRRGRWSPRESGPLRVPLPALVVAGERCLSGRLDGEAGNLERPR